ncbi:ABC transporter permease subunit [Nocardioides sp. LHD-245]|uniref:ABC transporter permease n=1 Tax=Nocardioides sp. LHD-245 TaxID=3051387 RepID=UPI0027E05284|nr:ABC transporter permease subunit [Nocardioides sp. LHD-245]
MADARRATRARPGTPSRRTGAELLARLAVRLVVPGALVALWWWASTLPDLQLYVVSPPTAIDRFINDFLSSDPSRLFLGDAAHEDMLPSVRRALAGLAVAVVVGVVVGTALGISRLLSAMAQPLIHLGRSLPSPALLGVFFFVFGTGDEPKVLLIAFSIVWPILFNTVDGVRSIGEVRSQAAQVFRIPDRDVLFRIILPGASPKILAGIRTSLSLSLILMIISELQKSENGLGYRLVQSQRIFDYGGFWAVLVMLVVLGLVFNIAFTIVERRLLAWHRGATQQND